MPQPHRCALTPMPALRCYSHRGPNLESPNMSRKQIIRSRDLAHQHQAGRCYYCNLPMWLHSPDELTKLYGLTTKQARGLRCTAEHLIPKCEVGSDLPGNIVAACVRCNGGRHKRKFPPSPEVHQARVMARVEKGAWHPGGVSKVLRVGRA